MEEAQERCVAGRDLLAAAGDLLQRPWDDEDVSDPFGPLAGLHGWEDDDPWGPDQPIHTPPAEGESQPEVHDMDPSPPAGAEPPPAGRARTPGQL